MDSNFYLWGWILVGLQIVLLLLWVYDVYKPCNNRNDAAGKALAKVFILALLLYVLVEAILMLFKKPYLVVAVYCMSGVPVVITIIGLVRYMKGRKREW